MTHKFIAAKTQSRGKASVQPDMITRQKNREPEPMTFAVRKLYYSSDGFKQLPRDGRAHTNTTKFDSAEIVYFTIFLLLYHINVLKMLLMYNLSSTPQPYANATNCSADLEA